MNVHSRLVPYTVQVSYIFMSKTGNDVGIPVPLKNSPLVETHDNTNATERGPYKPIRTVLYSVL
jgi:hypothetical protein